jgi:hypothetical protein
MYKYLLIILLLAAIKTKGQTNFKKEYFNGNKSIVSNSLLQNKDGTYLMAGNIDTVINAIQGNSAFIKKTDSLGNLLWTTYFSLPNTYGIGFNKIIKTQDNNYVAVGMIDYGFGIDVRFQDAFIAKIDSFGNMIWHNSFGGIVGDEGIDVKEMNNGDFVMFNSFFYYDTTTTNNEGRSFQLVRTNASGNLIWMHDYYHGTANLVEQWASSFTQTSDGGFAMVGELNDQTASYSRGYILKTDSLGNEEWNLILNPTNADYSALFDVYSFQGSFTVIGKIYNVSLQQTIISNYTNTSVLNWTKTIFTNNNQSYCSVKTADGGYTIVSGPLDTNSTTKLLKIDSLGNELYSMEIPILSSNNIPWDIIPSINGGLAITGWSLSNNPYSIFIAHISDSIVMQVEVNKLNFESVSVYPNPVEQNLYINILKNEISKIKTISIFNLQGLLIRSMNINELKGGSVDFSKVIAGEYFIIFYNEQKQIVNNLKILKI